MLFLISQIALFLLLAVLLGLFVGWWFKGRTVPNHDPEADAIETKRLLERCKRDNAALRREARKHQEDASRLSQHKTADDKGTLVEKLDRAQAEIQALMHDVQMRDDTIVSLQKQLKG